MTYRQPQFRQSRQTAPNNSLSDFWARRLSELPDLRWKKVMDARRRIRNRHYDQESTIDATVSSLFDDMGTYLCQDPPPDRQ